MTVDITQQLNPSQLQVVQTIEGPVLVIAGAGSGKTRVIEYRVLHMVQQGIPPQSILLLTFTRKAAQQMLARASRNDIRCSYVEGGTFHSFAYQVLKKHSRHIGFDSFMIIDESDAEDAIHLCLGKLGLNEKSKRFPRKDTLRKILSMSVNKSLSLDQVVEKEYPHFSEYVPEMEKIKAAYARYKMEKNYFDYDDLLIYLRLLLTRNENIRESLSEKFRYIMVDEYQDTNRLQADITFLLAQKFRNCMVVGDDAQSIYGFRGATHENIMEFPQRFAGCKVFKLEANYRSSQAILEVANAVLNNMTSKYKKELFSAKGTEGEKPQLSFFQDSSSEAEWIADRMLQLRSDGLAFSHQAVLFRSAYLSIPLQLELSRRSIPFQVYGGMKFYETAHVKDVLAHLKIVANYKDELSWARMLQLIEGIGPKTASKIVDKINAAGDLNRAVSCVLPEETRQYKFARDIARLVVTLEKLSDAQVRTADKLETLVDYYLPILKNKFDDWNQRVNDFEAIKQIAQRYDSLADFLADFALEPPDRGVAQAQASLPDEEKPVTLSTIHSAKGLEWECVFLIGLIDGVLPVSFALNDDSSIEEEQRLFYVALTRAKTRLFLSVHHENTGMGLSQFNKVSRFLDSHQVLSKLDQEVRLDYDVI